jgi:hypothetical protein
MLRRTKAVYIRGENRAGKEMREREGGKEGEVEVPYLLTTPSNVLD